MALHGIWEMLMKSLSHLIIMRRIRKFCRTKVISILGIMIGFLEWSHSQIRWIKVKRCTDSVNIMNPKYFIVIFNAPAHTGSDWDRLVQKVKKWIHDIWQKFIIFDIFGSSSIKVGTFFCNYYDFYEWI